MLLDGADDVERDLAGTAFGVVGATFVVVEQEGVDQKAGVFWRNTCMDSEKLPVYNIS